MANTNYSRNPAVADWKIGESSGRKPQDEPIEQTTVDGTLSVVRCLERVGFLIRDLYLAEQSMFDQVAKQVQEDVDRLVEEGKVEKRDDWFMHDSPDKLPKEIKQSLVFQTKMAEEWYCNEESNMERFESFITNAEYLVEKGAWTAKDYLEMRDRYLKWFPTEAIRGLKPLESREISEKELKEEIRKRALALYEQNKSKLYKCVTTAINEIAPHLSKQDSEYGRFHHSTLEYLRKK